MARLPAGNRNRYLFTTAILLVGLSAAQTNICRSAEPNDTTAVTATLLKSSGGYCGIYCLYGAMKYFGADIDHNELIKPEYIGSPVGSSLAELKKAAKDHGMYAAAISRLSTKDLRSISLPMIIHVKSSPAGRAYDHYELFLKPKDGKALIYDPPGPAELVPFRILAPRWDGSGLIISDKPIRLGSVLAPARWRFLAYAGIIVFLVIAIRLARRFRLCRYAAGLDKQPVLLSIAQCAILVSAAAAAGLLYNSITDEGLLAYKDGTESIQQAYRETFIPKLSSQKFEKLLNEQKAILIDPRPDYFFKTGHLQNAINIPPYATTEQRKQATKTFEKQAKLIVYCEDSEVRLAELLAVKLLSDGFSNVVIYKGQWKQWKTSNP